YQVMQLEVVHIADGDRIVERLAGTSVIDGGLAVAAQSCQLQTLFDVVFVCTVKDRCHDLPVKLCGCTSQMDLQHLTDVHTRRYALRVEHDVQRTTVCQKRHILLRQDSGNNTLVSVASRHLIADRN